MNEHHEVIKTITLPGEATGQTIIDSVKKLAGDEFQENLRIVDKMRWHQVGRNSKSPDADLIIAVDTLFSETYINPNASYGFLAVLFHPWPGKQAVNYSLEGIEREMEKFRDELWEELESYLD